MENYQGDLTDILRATTTYKNKDNINEAAPDRQLSSTSLSYDWAAQFQTDPVDDFGDPFSHLGDPLFYDVDVPSSSSNFFHNAPNDAMIKNRAVIETGTDSTGGEGLGRNTSRVLDPDFDDWMIRRPGSNIFSRMLQISSTSSDHPQPFIDPPRASSNPHQAVLVANDHRVLNISSKANCSMETTNLQISSPRNTAIKRRKSQTKKVVCIPAPTPANSSRSSGEIVPSDLWAWRKYGQKPIKGSPYPRGYYRCSSSKGCLARKQVERSRTDPNMLVITYTSEHNHPWPTQRNALAGSTRSQQSKTINNNNATSSKASKDFREQKANENHPNGDLDHKSTFDYDNASTSSMKDENTDLETGQDQEFMNDDGLLFPQGYKPTLQDSNTVAGDQSFFAGIGEFDQGNSFDELFKRGFSGNDDDDDDDQNKGLDSFSFYDWSETNNNKSRTVSSAGGTTPKEQ